MAFLELEKLTKASARTTPSTACRSSVEKGEFVSLLGPSGCGKTTTLQMIAGFVEPTAGAIRLGGPRPAGGEAGQARPRHRLPELCAVPAHDGGGERRLRAGDAGRRRRRAHDDGSARRWSWSGLGAFATRYPRQLSGGQQQRVALARALVIRPQILLLDEPLSNLDAKLREEMQIELRQIQRTVGTTTILVTHDQAEAMALSDRIVVMNQRPRRADRPAARGLRAAGHALRRELPRQDQPGERHQRCGPSASPSPPPASPARSRTRIFQGNHWLYQVDTADGLVTVIRQNTGEAMPGEGDGGARVAFAASPRCGGGAARSAR